MKGSKIWIDENEHIFMDMGDGITFQLVWASKEQLDSGSYLTTTWGYVSKLIHNVLKEMQKEEQK